MITTHFLTERNKSAISVSQFRLRSSHERLQESRADLSIARSTCDKTASQGRDAHHLAGVFCVEDRLEQLKDVFAIGTGVG